MIKEMKKRPKIQKMVFNYTEITRKGINELTK
jgi:hypothetical protein